MKNVVLFVSFVLTTNLFWDAESKKMGLDEIKEALLPVRALCIERVGTDPKMIDDANKGNFVPDRKLQCYYKCLMVMTRLMTKEGQLVEVMFLNIVEHMVADNYVKPVLEAMTNCMPIASQPLEGCELAYEAAKCFYENNPTLTFFP